MIRAQGQHQRGDRTAQRRRGFALSPLTRTLRRLGVLGLPLIVVPSLASAQVVAAQEPVSYTHLTLPTICSV